MNVSVAPISIGFILAIVVLILVIVLIVVGQIPLLPLGAILILLALSRLV